MQLDTGTSVSVISQETWKSLFPQLIDYAKYCVQPAYGYFEQKIGRDLKDLASIFQYASCFDSAKVNEPSLNELCMLPFLDSNVIVNGPNML